MTKEQDIEYEKMVIDIPKKTMAVSVACIFKDGLNLVMNTHTYSTEDVKERRKKNQEDIK